MGGDNGINYVHAMKDFQLDESMANDVVAPGYRIYFRMDQLFESITASGSISGSLLNRELAAFTISGFK